MTMGIGFETLRGSGAHWRAGAVYHSDLLHALRLAYGDRVRLLLVEAQHGTPIPDEVKSLGDAVISYPTLKRFSSTWAINHARHQALGQDLLPDRILKQQGVNILVCGVLERHTSLSALAYLADFQHVFLPELFEPNEVAWRNAAYHKTAERATRILVTGEAVARDYRAFAPEYADKARVLQPVSHVPESIYARDPRQVLGAYTLPDKFVYLPNQFWQHKNHALAFEALREVKKAHRDVFLVCTGNPGDSRNAGYFSQMLQLLSKWGLRDHVALLGSVPREDVFALIRQAAFVLNPSRFEGFGLSLAEARAVGKRVLVSDLPAHREQDVPGATYFDPNSASQLTEAFSALWEITKPGPDYALETQARQAQPLRQRAYGEKMMQVIREVYNPDF